MEYILALAVVGLVVGPIVIVRYAIKQNADLHDRLAAKSLEDYKYFKEGYPEEVKAYRKAAEEKEELEGPVVDEADQARREMAASS